MHTPAAYGQWSVFDHNGDNQSAVLGTRYGIWWTWYGQFEVGWLQPIQLCLGAGTSSVAPVLVSQDRDLCHVQLHPTWFEPTSECRSWPVVSYLYSGHLPVGLYLGRGSLLLVGPLFHFRQCHSARLGTQQKRTRVPLSLNDHMGCPYWVFLNRLVWPKTDLECVIWVQSHSTFKAVYHICSKGQGYLKLILFCKSINHNLMRDQRNPSVFRLNVWPVLGRNAVETLVGHWDEIIFNNN